VTASDADLDALLAQLTMEEKAALTAGADSWQTVAIERLGIGALKVTDGPNGARGDGVSGATATCFPVGVAMGATWDVDLVGRVGAALAEEARSKGARVLLGPTVNIQRTPLAGRNFECYAEDPYLTGRLASAFINGLQRGGVGASLKHFVANDSEYQRMTISSEVDERTLREIYLRPFEIAVATADPWTIMSSYNRINGIHASEHRWLLTTVLREEWGWPGMVVSDWHAVHETHDTAVSGLDLEMPGPAAHLGPHLAKAVTAGEVDEAELDASVRRILRLLDRTERLFDPEGRPPPRAPEQSDDRPEHRTLAREVSAAAMVLLRNEGSILPLAPAAGTTIAVIGPNAEVVQFQGGGSAQVRPHYVVHPLAALRDRLEPAGVTVVHEPGCLAFRFTPVTTAGTWSSDDHGGDPSRPVLLQYFASVDLTGEPVNTRWVKNIGGAFFGRNIDGLDPMRFSCRYQATFTPTTSGFHRFGVSGVGLTRVVVDGTEVCDNWTAPVIGRSMFGWGTEEVVGDADLEAGRRYQVTVEYAHDASEQAEATAVRLGILEPTGDLLGPALAAARAADVAVVIVGATPDCESEGFDRTDMALVGGQDELVREVAAANPNTVVVMNTGSPFSMPWIDDVAAVLQVWFGGQEMGNALADVLLGDREPGGRLPHTMPRRLEDVPGWLTYPGEGGKVRYGEGVFVGYRGYDELARDPLFPFGHGLGYTTFAYDDVAVGTGDDGLAAVSVTVTNTGDRSGSSVVQVYVDERAPAVRRPPRELAGFARVELEPGASERVTVALDDRAFAHVDPRTGAWTSATGEYAISVGTSSRDLRSTVVVTR
jgi:beta-glucosidase